jgi:hypothetical protein
VGPVKRKKKSGKSKQGVLLEQLEDVSWRLFEEYPEVVQELIRRRPGVYVLYRKHRVHYVGLAGNLMRRVKSHLKDHHKGVWDRFSVYLAGDAEHIKALESLLLRIVEPKGNRQSGRFPGARNLLQLMNRRMVEIDANRRARLLGGAVAERRLRSQAKKGGTAAVFAGLSERRVSLRAKYKGRQYRASLRRNGTIGFNGKSFASPSAAAMNIVKRHLNGLSFWRFRNKKRKWVPLRTLIR